MTPHPFIPNLYATPEGRVFLEITGSVAKNGYVQLQIPRMGKPIIARRHRIVCECFNGEAPVGQVTRHKNGVYGDDRSENLEWGTQFENCGDTVAHGRSTLGSRNPRAKLTEEDVRIIRQRIATGESTSLIARDLGVAQPTISNIKTRTTWKHV